MDQLEGMGMEALSRTAWGLAYYGQRVHPYYEVTDVPTA